MKKSLRKLTLSRETLRTLDNAGLGRAAGAAKTDKCFTDQTCPPSYQLCTTGDCDYTLSCPELCMWSTNPDCVIVP